MHPYTLVHSTNEYINDEVSYSTIDLLCNHKNVNIILDPVTAMEEMGTQKQRCTMFRKPPLLKVKLHFPSTILWR